MDKIVFYLLPTIVLFVACTKEQSPSSDCGVNDTYQTYDLTTDYNDWFPIVSVQDSVVYKDSLGNEITFVYQSLDSVTYQDSWQDLTYKCPADNYEEWEQIELVLSNSTKNINMKYTLSSHTQDHLLVKVGDQQAYYRIPLSENLSYNYYAYFDTLDLFGTSFYDVFQWRKYDGTEYIFLTQNQGIVGFRIAYNSDTLFYRLK